MTISASGNYWCIGTPSVGERFLHRNVSFDSADLSTLSLWLLLSSVLTKFIPLFLFVDASFRSRIHVSLAFTT